jgi:multisubunit Na+/H+ antiporter MnhG subunit
LQSTWKLLLHKLLLLVLLLLLSPNAAHAPSSSAVDNGLEYSPDEIVVSNGAKQAIWQVR